MADHHYVVATFLTGRDKTRDIFAAYRRRRQELGHGLPNNDRTAYAALVGKQVRLPLADRLGEPCLRRAAVRRL